MNIHRPGSRSPLPATEPNTSPSESQSALPLRLSSVDQARSYIQEHHHFEDRLLAYCWLEGIDDRVEKGEIEPQSAELLKQAAEMHAATLPLPDTIKDKASAWAWLQQHIKTDDEMANLSLAFRESGCDVQTVHLLGEAMREKMSASRPVAAERAQWRRDIERQQLQDGQLGRQLRELQNQQVQDVQRRLAAIQLEQRNIEAHPLYQMANTVGHYTQAALQNMGAPGQYFAAGVNRLTARTLNTLGNAIVVNQPDEAPHEQEQDGIAHRLNHLFDNNQP